MKLFKEIHRRSLWQILGIYLAASWIALQVVNEVADSVGLPDWVSGAAIVLLVLGFPVVMTTAFVQRGGPARGGAMPRPFASPSDQPFGDAAAPAEAVAPVAEPSAPAAPAPDPAGAHQRLFTWKNATAGGVLAFALLGVVAAGYMTMRTMGIGPAASLVAAGLLDERSRIVLADFQSQTGDDEIAGAVTELLRVGLSQSEVVRLYQPSQVRSVLARMERPEDAAIDPELAREVALREGLPAIIAGEINAAGPAYAISARVIAVESGDELVAYSETARDSAEVIPAVEKLSKRLREKIGESLSAVRNEEPLQKVTTADLDALRKYTTAMRVTEVEDDDDRAIALLEEVVAQDTAFAMAWRKLAILLSNNFMDRDRQVEAFTRAFEHRDRLTEAERYLAMASYYGYVTEDRARAITAYENLLEVDPEERGAMNNLGNIYASLDEWERAEELYDRGLAIDSSLLILYNNALNAKVALGKFDEAERVVAAQARHAGSNSEAVLVSAAFFEAARGDLAAAEDGLRTLENAFAGNQRVRGRATSALGALAAKQGRIAEMGARMDENVASNAGRGQPALALGGHLFRANWLVVVANDTAAALDVLERGLERYPLGEMVPLDRPYLDVAAVWALLGEPERARAVLDEYRATIDPDLQVETDVQGVIAVIAVAEGRWEDAIAASWAAEDGRCPRRCGQLAWTYNRALQTDSALAQMKRYVDSPSLVGSVYGDAFALASFHERLGQLYDERGDLENAAKHYAAFVELWADADAQLQPRVVAAQTRLQEIVEARG